MAENPYLSFDQVRAAMNAMTEKALELPNEPVAMAIVDDTGNMVAYAKMDNLRMFSRRHAIRKAYTSAMMGQDSGAHGDNVRAGGRIVADMGDSMLTPNQGGRRWYFCMAPAVPTAGSLIMRTCPPSTRFTSPANPVSMALKAPIGLRRFPMSLTSTICSLTPWAWRTLC